MKLSNKQKQNIENEYNGWVNKQYGDKTLKERQSMGQFFTPPELSIRMIEKYSDLKGTVLDPCGGSGNLIAAMIMAGTKPKDAYYMELDPAIFKIGSERLAKLGVPKNNMHIGNALNPFCYKFGEDYTFKDGKCMAFDDALLTVMKGTLKEHKIKCDMKSEKFLAKKFYDWSKNKDPIMMPIHNDIFDKSLQEYAAAQKDYLTK